MKLFLDRNKTLLPRIDVIYLLTRLMTFVGILWVTFSGETPVTGMSFLYIVLGTFVVHLAIFFAAIKGRFDLKLAYLSAVIYDLLLIPILTMYTGGMDSSFFLLYYLTVSVAAYTLTFWFGSLTAILVTLSYAASIVEGFVPADTFHLSLRIGFIWVFFLAFSYASDHIRKSEKRLLKLFDTLNKRTSELEKSQAQLEVIYENSRTLASILDTDGVISEVMRILGTVMSYSHYGVLMLDSQGNFYFRSWATKGRVHPQPRAIDQSRTELLCKVLDHGEALRVKDVSKRDDYETIDENSRSLIMVPLTAHGRITGAILAEDTETDIFQERDEQMLSAVARSAGLALDNAELHRRTEELTVTDELTGTYNYRYFVHKLQEEKRRAARYELPLSLIMVDIDWFKKLNDNYGHESGNVVLRDLARIIKGCVRDVDIFCRYGGEEFVVILPQTELREAFPIGERIRQQVEQSEFSGASQEELQLTVSVGISSFPENGKSHEELVTAADEALYRAKDEGRNLVCTG
ncbi:MAG: sensor domain-containing diguanylate cyclase [bacterium]|nr:sensor domain-containing diguanylate cyclase [bacterium]